MRRFLITYRWELLLLFVVLYVSGIGAPLLYSLTAGPSGSESLTWVQVSALHRLSAVVLLAASYLRVRRLDRKYLTLVWAYALAAEVILGLVWFIGSALLARNDGFILFWGPGAVWFYSIALLPVLLWFARRASRFSLAHAFFLFLIARSVDWETIQGADFFRWVLLPVNLGLVFLLAWMLGNFDARAPAFRNRATSALLTLGIVVILAMFVSSVIRGSESDLSMLRLLVPLLLIGWLLPSLVLPLALIYLVRVRQPVPVEER